LLKQAGCHPERACRMRRAVVAWQTNSGGEPKSLASERSRRHLHFFLPLRYQLRMTLFVCRYSLACPERSAVRREVEWGALSVCMSTHPAPHPQRPSPGTPTPQHPRPGSPHSKKQTPLPGATQDTPSDTSARSTSNSSNSKGQTLRHPCSHEHPSGHAGAGAERAPAGN
jgi:hypothetical protein